MKTVKTIALLGVFGVVSLVGSDSVLGEGSIAKIAGEKAGFFVTLDGTTTSRTTTRTTSSSTTRTTTTRSSSLEEAV